MKNFLSKHYNHYYIQTADGQHLETTRKECLTQGESPTAENPFKQRWFYDDERQSYIIRLPRNEQGEALHRMNAAYIKNEDRYQARKLACVLKGTGDCDNDCDNCQRKRFPRIVELDKPISNDGENDGEPQYLDIAGTDDYAELEEHEERSNECSALHIGISRLEKEHRIIIDLFFFKGKTQKEIAAILGKDQSSVSRQITTVIKNLKNLLE